MEKEAQLQQLYQSYRSEVEAAFPEGAPHAYVWGFGQADSPVVLLGEAPGKDEVLQGRPFVGKAGGILREFLRSISLPAESLFITNTIKYRLARPGARPGSLVNRPAKRAEILFSSLYIKKELDIIKPKVVVTLGNVPLKAVLLCMETPECHCGCRPSFSALPEIGMLHGIPVENNSISEDGILFPMYHPASMIYNQSLKESYVKDLSKLAQILEEKIF